MAVSQRNLTPEIAQIAGREKRVSWMERGQKATGGQRPKGGQQPEETTQSASGGPAEAPNVADAFAADAVGRTRLHQAAEKGYTAQVRSLLAAGADVNARDKYGDTPLHLAASQGRQKVVELLLAHGADATLPGRWSSTALHHTAGHQKDLPEMASLLLSHGADVNARDAREDTPLHNAAEGCHPKMVELLLAQGADAHAKNCEGHIPLRHADEFKGDADHAEDYRAVVSLLRKYGGVRSQQLRQQQEPGGKSRAQPKVFSTPPMTKGVFEPCQGQKYKFTYSALPRESCEQIGYEYPTVLFAFGSKRMSLSESSLFSGSQNEVLTFDEYKDQMELSGRGRVAPMEELCAGFQVLLYFTGRHGQGAPQEPEDLGWSADWAEQLKGS